MDEYIPDYEELLDDETAEEAPEQNYRLVGIVAILGAAAIFGVLVLINSLPDVAIVATGVVHDDLAADAPHGAVTGTAAAIRKGVPPPAMVLSLVKPFDTIFTTDSLYLDVNLTKQNVTVKFKNGTERTFLISSGNPYIREGMSTPTGVFTVQSMMPMAISKQFNNARLHNWIGVQGGVGFHGLDGSGYYGYLGVRPSSHGCLRMSREEIKEMFKLVHSGALIRVHYGTPARVIAFCEPSDTVNAIVIDSARVYERGLGKERLRALFEGRYWVDPQPRLIHRARQRFRWGMEVGDARRIPKQQIPETSYLNNVPPAIAFARRDRLRSNPLPGDSYQLIAQVADSIKAGRQAEWKESESN